MSYEKISRQLDEGFKMLTDAIESLSKFNHRPAPEKLNQAQASAVIRCWRRDREGKR